MKFLRRAFTLIRLYPRIIRDPRAPLFVKVLSIVGILYLFFPFDLIPDFIPFLGELDDITVIFGILYLLERLIPPGFLDPSDGGRTRPNH